MSDLQIKITFGEIYFSEKYCCSFFISAWLPFTAEVSRRTSSDLLSQYQHQIVSKTPQQRECFGNIQTKPSFYW